MERTAEETKALFIDGPIQHLREVLHLVRFPAADRKNGIAVSEPFRSRDLAK